MDKVEAIETLALALREGSRFPSGQPRMSLDKCREIALTAAEPFFELAANINECIAELGDDEPFVVQRGPDGWEVRKMTAWKVLNPEVFADVRDQWLPIETAPKEDFATFLVAERIIRNLWNYDVARRKDGALVRSWDHGPYEPAQAVWTHWQPLSNPPVLDEVVGTGEEQGNEWDDLRPAGDAGC